MKKETIFLGILLLVFALPMILLGVFIAKSNILGIAIFSVVYILCYSLFMWLVTSVNKKQ